MINHDKLVAHVLELTEKNKKLEEENSMSKKIIAEFVKTEKKHLKQRDEAYAEIEELYAFKQEYYDGIKIVKRERQLNIDYTQLVWECTQEIEKRGGRPEKFREKLTKISNEIEEI